jgi:hypothetical protein
MYYNNMLDCVSILTTTLEVCIIVYYPVEVDINYQLMVKTTSSARKLRDFFNNNNNY